MTLRSSVLAGLSFTLAAGLTIGCGGSSPGTDAGAGGSVAGSGGAAGTGGGAAGTTGGSGGGAAGTGGGAAGTGGGAAGTGGGTAGTGGGAAGTGGSAAGTGGGGPGQAGRGGSGPGQAGRGGSGPGQAGRGGSGGGTAGGGGATTANAMMNFFVTSDTAANGNLGGLTAADARCQSLAAAVGQGAKTWRAYLCTSTANARDRIGAGPYYNSAGTTVAADKDALHARSGDAALFIDERGGRINGQWAGSPAPNQHDILTGCNAMGMVMGTNTCMDWTSGTSGNAQVGHSDGLGPSMNMAAPYNQWAGSHTVPCNNITQGGGAGRIYCFVGP
jgi:hypothetical protein